MSLELFDVPDVDYRYEASREVEFQPALTGIQPITFSIPGSDDYYDLNSLRFKVKVRLTDPAAGYTGLHAGLLISDANETRHVYCVNNFGHTIFRDITMSMNGVLVTEQSNTYHYRAYIETLLNYNREEGATKLAAQGWVNQLNVAEEIGATAANSDVPVAANWSGNAELRALTSKLLSENWHTFIVRPHLPTLHTGKLLVPNIQLDFELFLNPKTIYLMGSPNKGTLVTKKIPAIHNDDIKVTFHGSLSTSPSTVGIMIRQPSSVIIAGPSGSGKTDLVEQWLRYLNVFQAKPRKIVYAYDRWQPRFERMQQKDGIQFYRGLPDPRHLTQWFGRTRGGVLVLDDLMEEGGQDKRVLDLFTKDSHHRNITVLYLTQDLFPPGKFSKTINRNAHYIVAFKNPRDQTGIRTILLQAFPDRWRQVLRLFKRITARPFGYLMLDQDIEDFNLTYPVNVDDALNAFTLPPVAGTGTAPVTTATTAAPTRPTTTTTTTSRPRPVTSTRTRPTTTATTTTAPARPSTSRRSVGAGTRTTTSTTTTPTGRPTVAAKQPRRRPRVPSPPSPGSSPPSDDEDGDDDDDDRRRGLRRRLDLLNEDAQERARGRRIRNITHTNTVTTVYEEGSSSVRRTSTRTSSPSP
ncbi:unnamed protein product, partial [Porites lobata]